MLIFTSYYLQSSYNDTTDCMVPLSHVVIYTVILSNIKIQASNMWPIITVITIIIIKYIYTCCQELEVAKHQSHMRSTWDQVLHVPNDCFFPLVIIVQSLSTIFYSRSSALQAFASNRHHLSCDDCLEDKREDYQNCSVLYCVPQLHTNEQFLPLY